MIAASPEQIAAAKAECRKRFGHDRGVRVVVSNPATGEPMAEVLLANMTFADATSYHDARGESVITARSVLLTERVLWPSSAQLEELRSEWGAFDTLVEREYRRELGFFEGSKALCRPLTPATCPPGLAPSEAVDLLRREAGKRLWAISNRANGLSLVARQPQPDVWTMGSRLIAEAMAENKNSLCPQLDMIADHTVWCPGGSLRVHIDERPGRAWDLNSPWADMGGAAAKTSASRF